MALKIGLQGSLKTATPPNQKGFVRGRNMHEHPPSVQEIQGEGKPGAWAAMGFTKVFGAVPHTMLEASLACAGLPSQWVLLPAPL